MLVLQARATFVEVTFERSGHPSNRTTEHLTICRPRSRFYSSLIAPTRLESERHVLFACLRIDTDAFQNRVQRSLGDWLRTMIRNSHMNSQFTIEPTRVTSLLAHDIPSPVIQELRQFVCIQRNHKATFITVAPSGTGSFSRSSK